MATIIIFTNPEKTFGRVVHEGGEFVGPIPPLSDEFRTLYDHLIAEGATPEPYVVPSPPARVLKRRNFLEAIAGMPHVSGGTALDAMNAAAAAAQKRKDAIYWQEEDAFAESNPKLHRLAVAAGLDVKAMFDLGDPSAQA
jgi:hypothetical protein